MVVERADIVPFSWVTSGTFATCEDKRIFHVVT